MGVWYGSMVCYLCLLILLLGLTLETQAVYFDNIGAEDVIVSLEVDIQIIPFSL